METPDCFPLLRPEACLLLHLDALSSQQLLDKDGSAGRVLRVLLQQAGSCQRSQLLIALGAGPLHTSRLELRFAAWCFIRGMRAAGGLGVET